MCFFTIKQITDIVSAPRIYPEVESQRMKMLKAQGTVKWYYNFKRKPGG